MGVFVVGSTVESGAEYIDEMALPPYTQPEDLVLILISSGWVTDPEAAELPPVRVTDTRFAFVAGIPSTAINPDPSIEPVRFHSLWAGTAGDLSKVQVEITPGVSFGRFVGAKLVVLRDESGGSVELDGRVVSSSLVPRRREPDEAPIVPNKPIPGLPQGDGDTALLAIVGYRTEIGGLGSTWVIDRTADVWTEVAKGGIGSYLSLHFLTVDLADPPWEKPGAIPFPDLPDGAVPKSLAPTISTTAGWNATVIGIRQAELPVTRLYPRDDGRGLSSAPRLYPPPKSGRVVGGHQ